MRTGFDFADIIDEIMQRALGETSTAADVVSARRSIYMLLEDWHAHQYNTWRIRTADFGFLGGVPSITLPVTVDDVLTVTVVQHNGAAQTETPMERISETEYANLTTKLTAGLPTQFVLKRQEPPVMVFTPAGRSGRTETVRVTYIERPETFMRNSSDLDAPSRWQNALILGAAADLATKFPERAGMRLTILPALYERAIALATTNDRQRNSFKWRIG